MIEDRLCVVSPARGKPNRVTDLSAEIADVSRSVRNLDPEFHVIGVCPIVDILVGVPWIRGNRDHTRIPCERSNVDASSSAIASTPIAELFALRSARDGEMDATVSWSMLCQIGRITFSPCAISRSANPSSSYCVQCFAKKSGLRMTMPYRHVETPLSIFWRSESPTGCCTRRTRRLFPAPEEQPPTASQPSSCLPTHDR